MASILRPSLGLALVLTGCFEDPPSSSTSDAGQGTSTTIAASSTGEEESTGEPDVSSSTSGGFATGTTFGTTAAFDTSTGSFDGETLYLFPQTCTTAMWSSGPTPVPCMDTPLPGPYIIPHDNRNIDGDPYPRVVEVHPPLVLNGPIDGFYSVDTTGFSAPRLQVEVACVALPDCVVNYLLTVEQDGVELISTGGAVNNGAAVESIELPLPSEPNLVVHLNAHGGGKEPGEEDRMLFIDPRILEDG